MPERTRDWIKPETQWRVVATLASGDSDLVGHEVTVLCEFESRERVPRGYHRVTVQPEGATPRRTIVARLRRIAPVCACPLYPFPHRRSRKCPADPQ